jgi:hypothetical protein
VTSTGASDTRSKKSKGPNRPFAFLFPGFAGFESPIQIRKTWLHWPGQTNPAEGILMAVTVTGVLPGPAEKSVMASMMAEGDPTNAVR